MNNRFYINDSFEESPTIDGSEFHHLVHVMRAQNGDEIELVNGHGVLASARIETIKKKSASLRILHREKQSKPSPSLISAIAILRMEKLDWAIEKATELGADAITLFPAEHSEKKQLSENQVERLRNISIAAMKQCGRLYLPAIAILSSLERVLELDAMALFGDTDPKAPMLEAIPDSSPILFITGPEKGFSTSEDELLKQRAKGVRLHMNILRAETAPIVALSLLSRTLK
jgi:16S rRNA (uracil1498-N3)-methyltransferase